MSAWVKSGHVRSLGDVCFGLIADIAGLFDHLVGEGVAARVKLLPKVDHVCARERYLRRYDRRGGQNVSHRLFVEGDLPVA